MTLRHLYSIQGALSSLLSAEFDVRVAYRLRHFVRSVRQELRDAEEARMKLIRQHSPAGPLQQNTPEFVKFDSEWQELLESTITLPEAQITLAEMETATVICSEPDKATSRRKFLTAEVADLGFLITDDPPEPKKQRET
jgi:hypothetical protein